MELNKVYNMDCLSGLKTLPDNCVDCCVTSPPYYALRDYGVDGQIGLEETPQAYIDRLTEVFMEVHRVLKPEGTLWVNLGDSYATGTTAARQQSPNPGVGANRPEAQNSVPRLGTPEGCKTKDLLGIPWMLAFSLRNAGWYLRQDIIWHKPNPMPESVTDRCTKSHEYIFLLSKSERYYFDNEAIREKGVMVAGDSAGSPQRNMKETHGKGGGNTGMTNAKVKLAQELAEKGYSTRNKRDVWTVQTHPDMYAHFATYPEELIRPCILAGCPKDGIVLDPFMGSGTTARVARQECRNYIGFELNPEYIKIIEKKVMVMQNMFAE